MRLLLLILFVIYWSRVCSAQPIRDTTLEIMHTMIYFQSNDFLIDSLNKFRIKQLVDTLSGLRHRFFTIEAHTDDDGSTEFNKKLSDHRAESVLNSLLEFGVQMEQINSTSFGKLKPEVSNNTTAGKAKNRRVQLTMYGKFPMKLLKGQIVITDTLSQQAIVRIKDDIYLDSVLTDIYGNFSIFAPINRKLLLSVHSGELFAEPQIIFTRDIAFLSPLKVKVSQVTLNSVLTLKEINFVGGFSIVLRESIPSLEYLLQFMLANKRYCFEVAGHINFPGKPIPKVTGTAASEIQKMELSESRAKAVFDFLKNGGIDSTRMISKGYSNYNMKFPEPKNEAQMKANRRVEIIIRDCNKIK
jgi:outer membrane protein OmpA-like peptidoglycan-associated protein